MESLAEIMKKNMTNTTTQTLDLHCDTCPDCGKKTQTIIEILGQKRKVPVMCRCKEEEFEKEREADQKREQLRRLERLRKYSLMDSKFEQCTFENWRVDEQNKAWLKFGKNYCNEWLKIKENNVGFMLWGTPGTGKTYLTSCIANELLKQMIPVISISSIGLLHRIKETYKAFGQEGEVEVINSLKNASLLIIDDLGAENDSEWVKSKLYEILDSRYRTGKPIIITTNLTPIQLKDSLTGKDGVTRTYDRLVEMCPPAEYKGTSRRIESAVNKTKILKDLMK